MQVDYKWLFHIFKNINLVLNKIYHFSGKLNDYLLTIIIQKINKEVKKFTNFQSDIIKWNRL